MYLKMRTIRLECGGCPTAYSGQTLDGRHMEMRLRHGVLTIKLDGHTIVSESPSNLDGVCNLEDFELYASKSGILIDTSDAEFSSQVQDDIDQIEALFADIVWLKFISDFESTSAGKIFKVGDTVRVSVKSVKSMLETGLVTLESERDRQKFEKYLLKQSS